MDATQGRGVDIALDCSGVPATFSEAPPKSLRTWCVVVEAGAFVDIGRGPDQPDSASAPGVSVVGVGGEKATEYEPVMRLMVAILESLPLRTIVSHILTARPGAGRRLLAQSEGRCRSRWTRGSRWRTAKHP